MPIANIFGNDLFTMASLTDAVNALPFKPSRIGQMGLYQMSGVTTTSIIIEEKDGILALISTQPRGGTNVFGRGNQRKGRSFLIPHIPLNDRVMAEDVTNVRAFGSETALQGVARVVNDRLALMRQSHEVTLEYHRIGGIHGVILDADGSTTIYNLFTEFGVTEVTVDFALSSSVTDVRGRCLDVAVSIEKSLGAAAYDHIHCFCGLTWFKAFVNHTQVKVAYERWRDGVALRNDPRKGFEFAGITFEVYRGTVSGVAFINASQARFFPVGVPNLFKTYFAPADFMETVNTVGIAMYAKQAPLEFNVGVKMHTQSNPLCMCTQPKVLVKGTTS